MYPNYINKPTFTGNATFGAASSSFGQPAPNTSMFPSMQPPNIFQTPSTSSFSAGPSTQSSFGTNLFGQTPQPSTSGGLFGSTNAFGQNKATFGFGTTPSQTGLFGQQPQQQTGTSLFQPNSTNLFGNSSFGNQTNGTVIKFSAVTGSDTMQKNGVTQSISTKHHCITCMKEYENKSLEELRFEDYSSNRKGPQQQSSFGATPFGTATTGTTPSLFGQTDNKQAFGQPQGFGQTPTFGQPAPAFGVTNQTNTPSLFGKPNTFGATTSNTSTFGFNATPTTSNPFSANQTQKPFSQPLFGTTTTQTQPAFGTGVFGQTNTQNTTGNLFQKPAQPATGFTGQQGFSFSQTGTTQASNLFQVSKPNTGFCMFGQNMTGTPGFGQTTQSAFGTNFGKLTPSTFTQPTQSAFGTNLAGGPPLFGTPATKPPNLFGTTTTGGSLFANNVFQQTPTSFSLNMNQQQPVQFPPEPSEDSKNITLVATDSFPDGPHVYGLDPVLGDNNTSTTNPQDIKAMLDYSKKPDETSETGTKIKVHLPKRGNNSNKEFFETNQTLKSSHKCLVIRKFNENSSTIYNKCKSEVWEEAEDYLKASSEADSSSIMSPRSFISDGDYAEKYVERDPNKVKKVNLKPQFESTTTSDETEDTKSNKSTFTFDDSEDNASAPLPSSNRIRYGESKSLKSSELFNGSIGYIDEETTLEESELELTPNVSTSEVESTENPAGVILTRPEYYIYPALKDLHQYMDENGECIVQGLTIGRRGYGNVYFPDPINIANMNLDEIVHFRHREVIIYPDDSTKPPVNQGLNRRAQVTLDKIFPREKGTNNYITDINQIIQTNFVDNLMHVTQKHNSKFVDYRPKTGSWVFKVKHFSKYAFTDSDEEECEVSWDKAIKKAHGGLKNIEETEEVSQFGLGGGAQISKSRVTRKSDSFVTDPTLMNYWQQEQYIIPENLYRTRSAIQTLKFSLFTNIDKATETEKVKDATIKPKREIRSEVISVPKVHKLPDISLVVVPEKVTTTQRCYTELGIFRCNTYKVGWGKGFSFYNSDPMADNEVVYAVNRCKINVEKSDHYNAMMPNLTDLLKNTLEESDFSFDKNEIPTLCIKQGSSYLLKQTNLFNLHVDTQALTGREKYLSSVWNLCFALWGPGDNSTCGRRQNVSNWLEEFAYDLSNDLRMDATKDLNETKAFKTIFKLMSFHKISQACDFASRNNLSQFSLLISQLSANERFKFWLQKYTESFAWKEKGVIVDDFKKLYLLLSGIPMRDGINTCENLDWMRSFGLHLWYIAPAAAPIHVAFNLYKQAFEDSEYATRPKPPYCDESQTMEHDLAYHILALYVDNTHQLCKVLHPETHTENVMDYRLSWFMLQLFLSLRVGLVRESEKEHLHATFSTQLENMGLWKWAIFSLLFLKDNIVKKNLVMKILDRNLSTFAETGQIERDLVKTFKIPPSWIHQVKATKAKVKGDHYEYFQYSIYMEDWQRANNEFVEYILPELFVNGQFEHLTSLIKKIEPVSNAFVNWNTQVGLIKEFIELRDMLCGNNQEGVSFIGEKMVSVVRRITCFPRKNDKQRLCVAELSRKCALLFKLLHKTLDRPTFDTKFVDVFATLMMPTDIKQYEIFHLISKHIREQPITQ